MGFDLFVHRLRDGRRSPYPQRIAEEILDRDALEHSRLKYVKYPDGRAEIYCNRDSDDFDGFMLAHFGGHTICERVLEIADVTKSLIFWPSPNIWMGVTDVFVIEHLPDDMKVKRSAIALVKTVEDLWAAINA